MALGRARVIDNVNVMQHMRCRRGWRPCSLTAAHFETQDHADDAHATTRERPKQRTRYSRWRWLGGDGGWSRHVWSFRVRPACGSGVVGRQVGVEDHVVPSIVVEVGAAPDSLFDEPGFQRDSSRGFVVG